MESLNKKLDEPSIQSIGRRAVESAASTKIEAGLRVTINGKSYLAHSGDILGRDGTLAVDQFLGHAAVSRRHVEITMNAGRWFITVPTSVANSTRLDGIEVNRGQRYPLLGKHILKLSASCIVSLEV